MFDFLFYDYNYYFFMAKQKQKLCSGKNLCFADGKTIPAQFYGLKLLFDSVFFNLTVNVLK